MLVGETGGAARNLRAGSMQLYSIRSHRAFGVISLSDTWYVMDAVRVPVAAATEVCCVSWLSTCVFNPCLAAKHCASDCIAGYQWLCW